MIQDILYDYQEEVVPRMVAHRRVGLFDDPGSGKTIMALGMLERDGLLDGLHNILILATKTGAALTWAPTVKRLTGLPIINAYNGPLAKRRALAGAGGFVIANHAFIETSDKDSLFDVIWDAIVIDESHKVLPTKAETWHDLTKFWKGLLTLNTRHDTIRLAMSGTPDRGQLSNRYGTWKFLLPERYNSTYPYTTWLLDNFRCRMVRIPIKGRRGRFFIEQLQPYQLKDPANWLEMDRVMTIRRTKAEIAPHLPPKRYIDIERELPPKLEAAYEAYLAQFVNEDDGTSNAADTFLIRATQFSICEWTITGTIGNTVAKPIPGSISWKRDWIIEWLDERDFGPGLAPSGTSGGLLPSPDETRPSVVIASRFTEVLHWLADELAEAGWQVLTLGGSLSTTQRLAVQTEFQSGTGRRILLLSAALGDSIDLDRADDLIFIDEVQDPDVTTQVEDRVHRVSRNHHVFIWRLRSLGTADMIHATKNQDRFDTTRTIYDGSRDVDFARNIVARLTGVQDAAR